jgi:hypothetical protein
VVGDAIHAVVEDVIVGRDPELVEGVAGYRPLDDGRRLGQDTLAGAASVELVGR